MPLEQDVRDARATGQLLCSESTNGTDYKASNACEKQWRASGCLLPAPSRTGRDSQYRSSRVEIRLKDVADRPTIQSFRPRGDDDKGLVKSHNALNCIRLTCHVPHVINDTASE